MGLWRLQQRPSIHWSDGLPPWNTRWPIYSPSAQTDPRRRIGGGPSACSLLIRECRRFLPRPKECAKWIEERAGRGKLRSAGPSPSPGDEQSARILGVPCLIRAEDGIHTTGPDAHRGGLAGGPAYPP